MIYELMKRDPAWKAALVFLVPEALWALAISGVWRVGWIAEMPLYGALLFTLAAVSDIQLSQLPYYAALPVRVKQIWIARVASMMALVWTPGLTAAALVYISGATADPLAFIRLSAIAMPIGLVLESLALREIQVPFRLSGVVMGSAAVAIGGFAVAFPQSPFHLTTGLVLAFSATLSLAVFLWMWTGIPFAPRARAASKSLGGTRPARSPRRLWWLFSWRDLLMFAVLFILGVTGGSWASSLLFIWTAPLQSRQPGRRWIESLPVSRRRLYFVSVVPAIVAVLCGYLVGIGSGYAYSRMRSVFVTVTRQWPPYAAASDCGVPNVEPPLDHWLRAEHGRTRLIEAPWGESFRTPVVRIYGTDVYNPFAVGCGNTRAFFEWQHRRALMAVYGSPNPRRREGYAPPLPRTVIVNLGSIAVCALLAMLPVFVNDWWRFRRLPRRLRIALAAVLAAGAVWVFFLTGALNGLPDMVQWVSWALPDGMASAIAASVLIPLALYLAIERLFLKSELIAQAQPENYN